MQTEQQTMIRVTSAALAPDTLHERFRVGRARDIGERAYRVTNLENDHVNVVQFGFVAGRKLASCTCEDYRFNGRICKHMKAASPLHKGLMRQRADASRRR